MGMEQRITFAAGNPPSWPAVRELLATQQFEVQLRMIDGELVFPDEQPPESWRELRLATQERLALTVRRQQAEVVLVVWGNAGPALLQAWNALAWAFAELGNGMIQTADGAQSPSEYIGRVDLPPGFAKKHP
jgi:hypothetical protein